MALLLGQSLSCSGYQPFERTAYLEEQLRQRLDPELAARVMVPFELDEEVRQAATRLISATAGERNRTDQVVDFIFSWLDLRYSLTPTRDAVATYQAREGNCLSFVNLFVGIGREFNLNPFYVEVEDYQRWNYADGVVVSRGHIVGGLNIDGELRTYDFLPYRPKSYRDFEPIDDLMATAHYYNNLAAEALMRGDVQTAEGHARIAVSLAPDFEKALNNLAVVHLRMGWTDEARALLESGLELHPTSVPLLTNLARVQQGLGRSDEAERLLALLEEVNETNPFYFVYRGEMALAEGDLERALDYMRRALRADSETPEVHLGLAKVHLALGDLAKARHHVSRALRLDATHEEARKYAALIESAGGSGAERR